MLPTILNELGRLPGRSNYGADLEFRRIQGRVVESFEKW